MANHVSTHVDFQKISDEGKAFLNKLYEDRVRKENHWFPDFFVDGENLTYEQSEQYDYTIDNIGAKWSYIEDFDPEYSTMNITSAWSCPDEGLIKLMEMIGEVDPDVVAYVRYEDEMPNFIGAQVMTANGIEEYMQIESEDLMEKIFDEVEGLREHWDEDEMEFDDEGQDMYYENMWDIINDLQETFLDEEGQFYLDGEHNAE